MTRKLFDDWLERKTSNTDVRLYTERENARPIGLAELERLVADHFVGQKAVLKLGGYKKALRTIVNSLPTYKRTQSGDLGELLATEYVDAQTTFKVPIRKLRWKSDRQMPLHGNDGNRSAGDPCSRWSHRGISATRGEIARALGRAGA